MAKRKQLNQLQQAYEIMLPIAGLVLILATPAIFKRAPLMGAGGYFKRSNSFFT